MIGGGGQTPKQLELPSTLRITLSFNNGPLKGERIRLTKSVVTVGRKAPADIVVPDPTVSGAHARFEIVNGIVTLHDTKSTNGTLVGGKKIEKSTVNNMDEVGFGDTRALLTVVHDPYGLYSDDLDAAGANASDSGIGARTDLFENCLLGGYNFRQKMTLEEMIREQRLAKECNSATGGGEFIEIAARGFKDGNPTDLVITEIRMPLLNGVQASIAFRHMEKAYGIMTPAPIVLFTELAGDANIAKAVEYLKPAKYLQAVADQAEFDTRAAALIERLVQMRRKAKPT